MKRNMTIVVKGKNHTWAFDTKVDTRYVDEWLADGLDIYEVRGNIPYWMVGTPLMRPWVAIQEAWHWLKLW